MISYIKAEEFNIDFDGKRETLNIKDFKWNNLINTNIIPVLLKETKISTYQQKIIHLINVV